MSYLYNVYSSPKKGQWGFTAVQDGAVRTAFVDGRDQQVTLETIAPIKLAPTLARLLRSGYRRETHPQYLLQTTTDGMNTGRFVLKHPDLGEGLRGEMVLFAALPPQLQMVQAVDEWEEALRGADSPDHGARAAWLAHCRQASTYAPAMSHDPHGPLIVAQWARQNSLVLIASQGSLPAASPKDARYEWREFLQQWFKPGLIDESLAQLGWPLREAMTASPPAELSTLPEGEDRWLDLTHRAAF